MREDKIIEWNQITKSFVDSKYKPNEIPLFQFNVARVFEKVSKVDLTGTEDDRDARTESLDFRHPVFLDLVQCSNVGH